MGEYRIEGAEERMPSLRSLTFTDWDEVESDLQRLLQGYEQHGNWNLAQMSLHLQDWMSFPMDGFPKAPWFMRLLLGCMRATAGKTGSADLHDVARCHGASIRRWA